MPKSSSKSSRGVFQNAIGNIAVWYLGQRNIATFLEAVGLTLDAAEEQLFRGLRLSNPYRCPPEHFPALSRDRKIKLYQSEPNASKRYRLAHWRQLRRHFGGFYGQMLNIRPFFMGVNGTNPLPWIRIVSQSGDPGGGAIAQWHTMDPLGNYSVIMRTPSNWNWDGQAAKWSRYWVIIYWPAGYDNYFNWNGGPAWNSGPLWDGVPQQALDDIVAGLKEAKAAHSLLGGLIFTPLQPSDTYLGAHPFDPTANASTYPDGSTSLPIGSWGYPVYLSGPSLGLGTRAPWASYYQINNG